MNKWMKSGLGAALAVAMLAGSGNAAFAAEDFENKELSIAVFEGGFGSDYWYSVVDAFEQAYPGVKVDMHITDVFEGNAIGSEEALKDQIVGGLLTSGTCSPYGDGKIY